MKSYMLKLTLITPAARGSRAGNRATATRWAGLLRSLGHRVMIAHCNDAPNADFAPDAIIALHAWRSHGAIQAWHKVCPQSALAVVLTGTDVYHFQFTDPKVVYESLDRADALIGLHDCLKEDLPARYHPRLRIVHQSAHPLPPKVPSPSERFFDILVAGHLREEKDSLRAAYAVRDVPAHSRLRVVQLGGAHSDDWARAADEQMRHNNRYQWLGDRPRWQVRQWMARARAMVISSRMEGGANVVSEACVAGLPVIASDIAGNRGLLGEDYDGYYPVADTGALSACLKRAEENSDWLAHLRQQVKNRAPLFTPEAERDALASVLAIMI